MQRVTPHPIQAESKANLEMSDQTPVELAVALDRLVDVLDAAVAGGEQGALDSSAIASAVRDCSAIARTHHVPPEGLIIALRLRLTRAAARVPFEERDSYLRAVVSLAIECYFSG